MIKVGNNDIMEVLMDSEEIKKAYYQNYLVYVKPVRQPSYIKRGLVFWLDGIDKGNITDAWVEKKNGYVFTNHGAVFNSDHVYLDGTAYLENTTASTPTVADGTIEVVYERETGTGTVLVPTRPANNSSYCGFLFYGETIRWSVFSSSQRYTIPNSPYLASVSLSDDRSLGNGYELTQGGNSYINESNNKPAYVGAMNGTSNYFTGKIYCIRIYNRKLTEEEVLANYAVDCYRFNLDWQEYITFEDPVVEQICVSTWGDGTGLTKGRAKLITAAQVQSAFQGNTEIQKFNEFRYFGIGTFGSSGGMFQNCTALTELTLPDTFNGNLLVNCFGGDTLLATLNLGNGKPAYQQGSNPNFNYIINVKIKDIGQFIDLQRNVTAFSWGNLFARYESSGAHLILAETNEEITSVNFPSGRTVVPWCCFNNMKSITSITLPSSVTEIKGYAFYGCSGISETVIVPSSVTSIGQNAFAYCSGLSSITVPSSVTSAPMSAFIYAGHKEGKLYIGGDLTGQNNTYFGYGEVEIAGNFISSGAGHQFGRAAEQEPSIYDFVLRVGGDLINTTPGNLFFALNVVFIEIGGQFTWSGGAIGSLKSGCIVHLGYDGIAGVVSSSNFGAANIEKIYVGDGSSAAHDNAILAQYAADTDWSQYSSKLATWYSYNGIYKNIQ